MPPLVWITMLHVVVRLWGASGLHGIDDLLYTQAAKALLDGAWVQASPWGVRYALIVPLAVVQAVWGAAEWALLVVPMAYSVLGLVCVYALGLEYGGRRTAVYGATLWAVFPLDAIQATELHADLPMSACLALSVLLVLRAEKASGRARAGLTLAAGGALGVASLAKETALALAALLLIRAIWRRGPWRMWGWYVAGFAAVAAMEIGWYWAATGDPMFRFSSRVWREHVAAVHDRDVAPYAWMLEFPNLLLNLVDVRAAYTGGFFLLVVAATLWGIVRRDAVVGQLTLWWGVMLLVLGFMPLDASFRHPLFNHEPRTLHPVFLPGLLAVGYVAARIHARAWRVAAVATGVVVVSAASVTALRIENRLWADTVRRACALVPPARPVVTDLISAQQIATLCPRALPATFDDTARTGAPSGPSAWLYDPHWLAWSRRYADRPVDWPGPPPSCPVTVITLDVVSPATLRAVAAMGTVISIERVVARWRRAPAMLFVCDSGRSARAGDAAHPSVSHEPHGGDP